MTEDVETLLTLSRALGAPERHLAIGPEGNASVRVDDAHLVIKASGTSLATLTANQVVTVRYRELLNLLAQPGNDDDVTQEAYQKATVDGRGHRPSVEALLHAVLMDQTDAKFIAHTHPIAVNQLLCSTAADLLIAGALFPDQIVVLGRHQMLVPYVDPGVPLARAIAQQLSEFQAKHGISPKVIYLANHGIFALGQTADEALLISEMAVKTSRILVGAIAVGGPRFMDAEEVDRIDGRPDEHYRRKLNGQK
jgi:rhamnose utilization protein RhaD (predicted bifunctional aldolase and dehydrogenase)